MTFFNVNLPFFSHTSKLIAAASLLAMSGSASALIIDTFETPQLTEQTGLGTNFNVASGAGILGTERDALVTVLAGTRVSSEINQFGLLQLGYSENASTSGNARYTWDGVDGSIALNPIGLGGIDFTQDFATGLILQGVTHDLAVDLLVFAYTDAVNFSSHTVSLTGSSPATDSVILFNTFNADAGGSGVDFSNVGALRLFVDGAPGSTGALDVSLQAIRTNSQPPMTVSVPSTSLLFGLGLLAMSGRFVRRSKRSV